MKWLKKIVAGLLLLWGVPISMMGIIQGFHPQTPPEDREGALAALALFGLPPVAVSGWLIYSLRQQHQASLEKGDRAIEQIFLQLLQENQGVINPVQFATQAQLTLDEAKSYLDQKAVQLNGLYEATDTGGVSYRFPL